MTPKLIPNKYAQAIFDFVENGSGDGAVNAVAGSGKTTTIIECANRLKTTNALFLAFNVEIVKTLQTRLGKNVQAMTLNSLGHRALLKHLGPSGRGVGTRIKLEAHKYADLVDAALAEFNEYDILSNEQFADALKAIKSLVSFSMSTLCGMGDEELVELAAHYGIDLPVAGLTDATVFNIVRDVLSQGIELGKAGIISFDDQIFLPVLWGLKPQQVDFTFVDECQDLSAAKLALTIACRAPGGRMLFVGDKRQSIYGFAGADANSFDNIVAVTNATVLPLSVCYRCPSDIIKLAQSIVPDIEAAPGAPVGVVGYVSEDQLSTKVGHGDLILCRLTAPLISTCIDLIRHRVPARVKGRDIGKMLVKIAKDALGKLPYAEIEFALDRYVTAKCEKLAQRKHSEAQQESLRDRVAGVKACVEAFHNAKSIQSLAVEIEALFTDGQAFVELSTVHRAKGLGVDRVFILKPNKLPLVWKNQRAWEAQQEQNLRYVAITRAQRELYFVNEEAGAQAPVAPVEPEEAPCTQCGAPTIQRLVSTSDGLVRVFACAHCANFKQAVA